MNAPEDRSGSKSVFADPLPDRFSTKNRHSPARIERPFRATSGLMHRSKTSAVARLFDHLVGAGEQCWRHVQANRLRHDQVNDEAELVRLLDRKIGGLRPPQNLVDQVAGAPLKSMKATVPTGVENSYFS